MRRSLCTAAVLMLCSSALLVTPAMLWQRASHDAATDAAAAADGDRHGHSAHARDELAAAECEWRFARYLPSEWEQHWFDQRQAYRDRECDVLRSAEHAPLASLMVATVQQLVVHSSADVRNAERATSRAGLALMSQFEYELACADGSVQSRRRVLIEPLVGFARDPLTMCGRQPPPGVNATVFATFPALEDHVQSKRFLLISPAAPYSDDGDTAPRWRRNSVGASLTGLDAAAVAAASGAAPPLRCRRSQRILVDMGASTYAHWNHSHSTVVGARWFVERYGRFGVAFDRVISFEATANSARNIFDDVPADLLPAYQYINQAVDATRGAPYDPWRILRAIAAPGDYVVVKLDIDSPSIENALVDRVLRNEDGIAGLIDELYYEHHTHVKAMARFWGWYLQRAGTPRDQYAGVTLENFRRLRMMGIRMHSWP